jgi:hypothetical protein
MKSSGRGVFNTPFFLWIFLFPSMPEDKGATGKIICKGKGVEGLEDHRDQNRKSFSTFEKTIQDSGPFSRFGE